MSSIVVIGAGASGLFAAGLCAERGNNVTLVEKMPRCARKVLITGKGRCNVTNADYDINSIISSVTDNPRFLYSSLSDFMPYDTIAFFEERGVKTKIERGNRVFPVSDKAVDIVDCLVDFAVSNGVKIIHSAAESFEFNSDKTKIEALILESGERLEAERFALCTGGKSYPLTGSTGDGYELAESAGHSITEIKPGLVGMNIHENWVSDCQGLSLKNVSFKLYEDSKIVYSDFGEMLFTHFGISGPMVLSASMLVGDLKKHCYHAEIDLKPALETEKLDLRIQRDFEKNRNKNFINALSELLPSKIIPSIVSLSKIPPSQKVNQITKEQRSSLVNVIKCLRLEIVSLRPIDEAIITRGGVSIKEINPKTMQSKLISNLWFAGEIIDVAAFTGGYNLQIAFSTGNACAKSMGEIEND